MLSSIALISALFAFTAASAQDEAFLKQTCGVGCVTGLLIMAFFVAMSGCFLMCCLVWPAPELIATQERRALAQKRIRERREEEEEARAKEEEIEEDE